MTQENLEIVLNRANCCIAEKALQLSKLWSIGSNCYKEELRNLKILNDSVDVLLNEAFTQNSIFVMKLSEENYKLYANLVLSSSEYIVIKINNVDHNVYGDDSSTALELILNYFESIGYIVTYDETLREIYEYIIETPCDINTLQVNLDNTNVVYGELALTVPYTLPFLGYYQLTSSGSIISGPALVNNPEATLDGILEDLLALNTPGLLWSAYFGESVATYTVYINCDYQEITLEGFSLEGGQTYQLSSQIIVQPKCNTLIPLNNIQPGSCQGCLTEEQINNLTEKVMSICSICNCELTT